MVLLDECVTARMKTKTLCGLWPGLTHVKQALLCNKTDVTFLREDNVFHVLRCKWWVKQRCCVQYACEPVLVDKNV